MYHYVRPILNSKFPNLKGLELDAFSRQLDFLQERFRIIDTQTIIDAVLKRRKLPPNACWLTFDDGYKDHFRFVLPELLKRKITGAFFPPKVAITEKTLLNVNAVHHILSCANDMQILKEQINEACLSNGIKADVLNEYEKIYGVKSRFDDPNVVYIKRMLQHALPDDLRDFITTYLFEHYVGITPETFSQELYMNIDEVRQMIRSGMYVGSHGSMHYWLGKASKDRQRLDITQSINFLEEIGTSTKDWIMCFPFGSYNNDTLELLEEYSASMGLSTIVRQANLHIDNPYALPRLNTNDFPQ